MDATALRAKLGHCMAQANRTIAAALKKHALEQPFQDEDLRALMEYHPRKKMKDFAYFARRKVPPFNTVSLTVAYPGHAPVPVSWVKCLQKLYGRHDPERSKRQRAVQAFREEASSSPKMCSARERFNVGACAGCQKRTKLSIDHDEKPFALILDEFLASKRLKLPSVTLNYLAKPFTLASARLADEWRQWHDEHATLIGLCKTCNSAKGSGGYRHKK